MDQPYNIHGLTYFLSPNENERVQRVTCNTIHNQRRGWGGGGSWIQLREKLICANNIIGFKKYGKHLS